MRTFLSVALFAYAVVVWATLHSRQPTVPESQVTSRPVQVASDGYVSSTTCKACHPSQYESWHGSFHRTMTQVATPDTVRASFDSRSIAQPSGRVMILERRGAEFWAEFDDPDAGGSGTAQPRIRRQVVMITGSHHQQVYWYPTGRSRLLGQLPAMYLIGEQRWIPRAAALLLPPQPGVASETGRWNAVCINCHTTHGKRALDTPFGAQPLDTQRAGTSVAEFGIACEACHGPSGPHVRANRNPVQRYSLHLSGRFDPTIVQPARLDPKLSSQVCGQCHSVWEFYDQSGERQANAVGFPYRPGDDMATTRFVAQPARDAASPTLKRLLADYPAFVQDSFWSDGMIRVSGREYNGLIDSPCFANATDARRTLSCFSCHNMHKAPEDVRSIREWSETHQVAEGMEGNEACQQCHPSLKTGTDAHTRHRADSAGSSCYNCHMPYTTYGLLKALRSHQISSPTVAASVQTGRPNACNLCHLDKTLRWTAEYLDTWYGTPRLPLGEDEQTIAASLLWLLRGDAGQRALLAWSLGWQPAQRASGTSWMAVYAAQLLEDPYDAVRFISFRSLRSLPGFSGFDYDFLSPPSERFAATVRALDNWRRTRRPEDRRTDRELLFNSGGLPDVELITRLMRQRNDRRVVLRE